MTAALDALATAILWAFALTVFAGVPLAVVLMVRDMAPTRSK